ncbi:peptidoglycan hydrolase-like protein with peptidoglycan-binding domain [Planomicrobium soli]|uniref:Peptidoglycan hydrolase-like protein with peptidoglycan-binding domain n=1 Tax=Planomicrobium soli TaxID=1176648 RepID=A0A2P8H5U8_9BACL|nr:peptidoglycan-binding protein [Planomicrobium soli]PSL41564.1 peptidoglycan hydrolase-like protein with peptidoglycan-binding domain [Planomicrobium soli]
MKKKWIPMLLAFGLLISSPLSFQSVTALSSASAAQEEKLPARLENLMDIAPEHQFTLRKGSVRIEVELLQWTLNQYGLPTAVDGIFGSRTEKNVRQYQKDKGLKVDGIVGEKTWVAVYGEHKKPADPEGKLPAELRNLMDIAPEHQFILREGSARIEVELLQWTLNQYGLPTAVDGIFGPQTEKNVRQYQKDKGLKVDGIVGEKTWVALYGEY